MGIRFTLTPHRHMWKFSKKILLVFLVSLLLSQTCFAYDSYTKLLCHFNGTTGDKPTPATTGQTITYVGTAWVSTAVAPPLTNPPDTASLLLDGNSDYVTVPDSADWDFGTGNFTIDCGMNFNSAVADQGICGQYASASNFYVFGYVGSTSQFYFGCKIGATWVIEITSPAFTPIVGTWYHIAIVRKGTAASDWTFYVGGVSLGAVTLVSGGYNGSIGDISADLLIGYHARLGYSSAYIDEPRISKGIARWTSDFTPPTKEYNGGYSHKVNGVTPSKVNGVVPSKVNGI